MELVDPVESVEQGPRSAAQRVKAKVPRSAVEVLVGWHWVAMRLTGQVPVYAVRRALYRRVFKMKIGSTATIYGGLEVYDPQKVSIGEHTIVGRYATIDGRGEGVTIGNNVNMSSSVAIWTAQHDPQSPDFGIKQGPVVVEDHVWLSFRATILPGVTIGRGAVVAANSVVAKDVPPLAIVAGIPAKVIGKREFEPEYVLPKGSPVL